MSKYFIIPIYHRPINLDYSKSKYKLIHINYSIINILYNLTEILEEKGYCVSSPVALPASANPLS